MYISILEKATTSTEGQISFDIFLFTIFRHNNHNKLLYFRFNRLTDVSKYTGAHKKRFDESGKGKGIEGRENATSDTGYVTGYHNMGTYDDKKQNN